MHSYMHQKNKAGFTMVELTVVLAVIAMLLSALSAAGEKSRYHARRAICENNLRQQITFQLQYANDNSGKFPPFKNYEPWMVYDKGLNAYYENMHQPSPLQVHQLYKPYFGPASQKTLVCPITKIFAKESPTRFGYYADTKWISLTGYFVGGWDANKPDGSPSDDIEIPYNWYMGFESLPSGTWTWLDGETPWPKTLDQCSSSAAAASHVFNSSYAHITNRFRNWIHGGTTLMWGRPPTLEPDRKGESPAAYSDGHIEQHQFESTGNSKLKLRVRYPGKSTLIAVAY